MAVNCNFAGPRIVKNNLTLYLDTINPASYNTGRGDSYKWRDISGNSNNGILVGGVSYNLNNTGVFTFNGIDSYVQCSKTIVTGQATFIAWLKRDGNQPIYAGVIFSRGSVTSGFGLSRFSTINEITYTWNNSPSTYNWASNLFVPDNTWCMVAITVAPTVATAYLCQQSGITSSTNNVSHASTTLNDIKIAADEFSFGSRLFKGDIAIAQIYTRALSLQEITQNFNATRERFNI